MRYVPAPADFSPANPAAPAQPNLQPQSQFLSDTDHSEAMAQVWQWALDADTDTDTDTDLTPEQRVAAENKASVPDEFTGDSFEDLFRPRTPVPNLPAKPRTARPQEASGRPFMRLVTD